MCSIHNKKVSLYFITILKIWSSLSLKCAFYSSFFIKVYIQIDIQFNEAYLISSKLLYFCDVSDRMLNYQVWPIYHNVWQGHTVPTNVLNTCCLHKTSRICNKNKITAVSSFLINSTFYNLRFIRDINWCDKLVTIIS